MIFWALAQRKKDKEKIEAAARAAGMAAGMAAGRAEGMAEGRAEERERIAREMEMRGIEVPQEILVGRAEQE